MGRYINPGNDGFTAIRKSLYVDKSGLIAFINKNIGTKDNLICASRPRRFGKSYAAQMLCAYYDKNCNSGHLFCDLEIAKDISYKKHLNKYNVIYLDITWFISTAANIKDTVSYLQKEVVQELKEIFPETPQDASSLPVALSHINKSTGNKFIILIDEWDALFREATEDEKLQKEYIQLLRGLFKSSQTDKIIEASYMTGILPIKKYGTQSALTDFREYSMLQPRKLAEYVGFTEEEVKKLCIQYNMDFDEMKRWYNGYSFNRAKSVYNPNSVIEAVKNEEFGDYWTQTETYEVLKIYIEMDKHGLKDAIIQMLAGNRYTIDTGTFQNDFTNINSKDNVLTLLIHLGYLAYDANTKTVSIPNEEVRQEFVRAVKSSKYTDVAKIILDSEKLLQDTLNMDEKAVAKAIEKIHRTISAPIFYNNEQALRSVIHLAYISCTGNYTEIQELPSGNGYADVVFIPKKNSRFPILVIELKWNKSAESAIKQIYNNHYPDILASHGSDMLLIGINYNTRTKTHSCKIEKFPVKN